MRSIRSPWLAILLSAAVGCGYSGHTSRSGRAPAWYPSPSPEPSTERYAHRRDSAFQGVAENPVSTFSVDVDTASYSNVRRFLRDGSLPPVDAVRIEELVNYFPYRMPEPSGEHPLAVLAEVGPCPWNESHELVRLGLRARSLPAGTAPPLHLTFLIDVSGSMQDANKLPLVKRSLELLVDQLEARDRVAIVVYAGSEGLVLPPTSGADRRAIERALERLDAGGSTNGGAGIELAYRVAEQGFRRDAVNRVILATDGDFNVGVSSPGELVRMVQERRARGIGLSVLGYGMGNLQDSLLELLADKGDGNYAYVDSLDEARKVLEDEAASTLVTVARDVKLQVEFNPREVASYRLIGYENRLLAREDFEDDAVDAGDVGAGHTVTALYEIVPAGSRHPQARSVPPLRYQDEPGLRGASRSGELLWLDVRYQLPDESHSRLLSLPVEARTRSLDAMSDDFHFAAAVAAFGMVLRGSERGSATLAMARSLALHGGSGRGDDPHRREFVELVDTAAELGRWDDAPARRRLRGKSDPVGELR
jgi:Ca-activated chloride channel homolog